MSEPYKEGYMIAVDQVATLTAQLAAQTARADALVVELGEIKAACIGEDSYGFACHLCCGGGLERDAIEHDASCILARPSADPGARGAALLAAAQAVVQARLRLLAPGVQKDTHVDALLEAVDVLGRRLRSAAPTPAGGVG